MLARPVVGQVGQVLEAGHDGPRLGVEDLADALDRTHAGSLRRSAGERSGGEERRGVFMGVRLSVRGWKFAAARGLVERMALTGTYVPSATKWVRKNVEEYEATNGEKGGTLRGTPYPVVVITSVGATSGNLRKNPVMRVERDGAYLAVASKGGAAGRPGVGRQLPPAPRGRAAGQGREAHLPRARAERRGARGLVGPRGRDVADVRVVPGEDRSSDPDLPARTLIDLLAVAGGPAAAAGVRAVPEPHSVGRERGWHTAGGGDDGA